MGYKMLLIFCIRFSILVFVICFGCKKKHNINSEKHKVVYNTNGKIDSVVYSNRKSEAIYKRMNDSVYSSYIKDKDLGTIKKGRSMLIESSFKPFGWWKIIDSDTIRNIQYITFKGETKINQKKVFVNDSLIPSMSKYYKISTNYTSNDTIELYIQFFPYENSISLNTLFVFKDSKDSFESWESTPKDTLLLEKDNEWVIKIPKGNKFKGVIENIDYSGGKEIEFGKYEIHQSKTIIFVSY